MNNKSRFLTIIVLLYISMLVFSETRSIENILGEYNFDEITKEIAIEILENLKAAGYKPGPDLDQLIENQGFDSFQLRELSSPPIKNKEDKKHNNNSGKIYSSLDINFKDSDFSLHSSAVVNGELLDEFKGEEKINGVEKSIPLEWMNIPEETISLAIIMYHYPRENDKTSVNSYLLLWNIDPSVSEIKYGEADDGDWCMGSNKDGNVISYTSPNSPSAGEHLYTISIFALGKPLTDLPSISSLDVDFDVFMSAVENSVIVGKADLIFKDINK